MAYRFSMRSTTFECAENDEWSMFQSENQTDRHFFIGATTRSHEAASNRLWIFDLFN